MKRLFIGSTATGLATTLVPVSAYAAGDSISKYAAHRTKSIFAAGLKYTLGLCLDHEGDRLSLSSESACTISRGFLNTQEALTRGENRD